MARVTNLFRLWYSKVSNTLEQLFHAWRSFNFDENTETMDAYVTQIRQVATLLGYGEPQILKVFKNTLPTILYWIPFPIKDLRQAVETAKRIFTKEKLDKQSTQQVSTSQFMSIREGANRRVSFDTKEQLNDKIDKLTVMVGKLAAKDSGRTRQFKPQIHQSKGRGQNRGYSQRNYQNRYRSDNRSNSRDRGQLRQDRGRHRFEQGYRRGSFQDNSRGYSRQNSRGEYGNNSYRNDGYNRGRDRSRERSFSGNYSSDRTRSTNNSRSRSGSRASANRDRIRCYNCREYDHYVRDCPTSREERDIDQLQQLLNLEEEQTHLLMNTQNSTIENPRASPLNLWMVGMAPPHPYLLIPT